jgi:uncharacterized protein (TIGR02453 family)
VKRSAQTVFRGFHPEAFRFFRRLARNNHKPWFDRHRALYDLHVVGALKGLFEALAPVVLALDPGFEISGKTGRNFSRINRDIRFARDKSPYRTNRYLYFGRRGSPQFDARLYVGLSGDGVTCGFAAYDGQDSALARLLKPRRAKDPARLDKFLQRLVRPNRASRYESYWHGVERGEWKKYPGNPKTDKDWKRCKAWVVRQRFAASRREVRSPQFAKTVAKIFRELFPLYAFSALEGRTGEQALQRAGRQ